MARVPSLYYDGKEGTEFHAKDKPILLSVVTGLLDFNILKTMVIRPEWLRIDAGDAVTDSMKLAMTLRDEYIREMPKLLRKTRWINRLAIQRLADFTTVLYRNDDMYYERLGYLMWRFIERGPEYAGADHAGRVKILHEERALYLTHEKRLDRIKWITNAWDYFVDLYATDEGISASVDFVIERLNVHKDQYNRDEVSRLGMKGFYPENWYPNGRGYLWDMAHGGIG